MRRYGWAFNFGDEHELLGLSFPRRFRHSRQHPSHIAATTAYAGAAASHATRTSAGHTASAATRDTTGASAYNTARAAAGYATCATSSAATRTAAIGSAVGLLARHAARAGRGARSGCRNRSARAALRR